MKVLFISREYPPHSHVGGIGTYTATAASLLSQHGHEVHVICLGEKTSAIQTGNLTVHRIVIGNHPLPQARLLFRIRRFIRETLPHFLDSLTWAKSVGRYISATSHFKDVDAMEWPETNGEGAFIPRGFARSRKVCRIHTSWMEGASRPKLDSWALIVLQRKACKNADVVVSPSSAMGQDYARRVLRLRCTVIATPNPLRFWDQPVSFLAKSNLHLLYVGRIEYRKGIDLLVQAIQAFPPSGKEVQVRIIGAWNPPYIPEDNDAQKALFELLSGEPELKPRVKVEVDSTRRLSNGITVEYLGSIPHEDLYRHFDWAGLLVMPTRMDNFPYVLLEGISRGCCILASDVGGVKEVCGDAPFAFWLKPVNAANLAEKMREWLSTDQPAETLWKAAHGFAETQFGEEAGYRRLMDLYGRKQPTASVVSNLETGDGHSRRP